MLTSYGRCPSLARATRNLARSAARPKLRPSAARARASRKRHVSTEFHI